MVITEAGGKDTEGELEESKVSSLFKLLRLAAAPGGKAAPFCELTPPWVGSGNVYSTPTGLRHG